MTSYDVAMVGVVIAGMIWGAWRGITWQVASIASLVLGYAVAYPLSAQLAPRFPGEPVVARALALLVVYAGVSGGVFLVAWLIRATLRRWKFEAFDRHLGMVLGGLEGGLVGLVVTLFVLSLAPSTREPILTSPSGRLVSGVLAGAQPILPVEVRHVLTPFWAEQSTPILDGLAQDGESEGSFTLPSFEPADVANEASGQGREALEKTGERIGKTLAGALADGIRGVEEDAGTSDPEVVRSSQSQARGSGLGRALKKVGGSLIDGIRQARDDHDDRNAPRR